MDDLEANQFEAYRPLMFSIAYRMLGSATEAEDIVQESYLRFQKTPPAQIKSYKAFLITIVTRLCLNQLRSARVQRETYIGPWLPEPVLTESDNTVEPAQQAELHDSISIAFLALLEQLTSLERAIFLLREVFGYEYAEITEIVGGEEAACRQVFSRAKKHIAEHRPRFRPTQEKHRQILNKFLQATATGELDELMQLLTEDVTLWVDSGGKARGAAIHPLHGRDAVARFVLASIRLAPARVRTVMAEVNGELAFILRLDDSVMGVISISTEKWQVSKIRAIGNPDKLKWVSGTLNDEHEVIQ